jgi:RIO kinase 1
VELTEAQAIEWHAFMISQIVRALCVGIIHGDLSEYNVLVDTGGPVIIDLPQAVNAAGNNNAYAMFERDVNNMRDTFSRAAPTLTETQYAREIWALYEANSLTPDRALTGRYEENAAPADVAAVLDTIEAERRIAEARAARLADLAD